MDVIFTGCSALTQRLNSGRATGVYDRKLAALARVSLLIIDDFGPKSLRTPADEDLHDLIAERHERAATIRHQPNDWYRKRPTGTPDPQLSFGLAPPMSGSAACSANGAMPPVNRHAEHPAALATTATVSAFPQTQERLPDTGGGRRRAACGFRFEVQRPRRTQGLQPGCDPGGFSEPCRPAHEGAGHAS